MGLTGFAGRLSICLELVEVRVEDSRLRGDTQGRVERRRWRSLALGEDGHVPWLQSEVCRSPKGRQTNY